MKRQIIILILFTAFLSYPWYFKNMPIPSFAGDDLTRIDSINQLKKNELLFKEKKSIYHGAIVLNISYFLKDYDKAIHYGRQCLNLGANKTSYAHLINLWLSASYLKKGDFDKAKEHLETAITLDNNKMIEKSNSIEKFDLQEVYNSLFDKD